jgi:hypothetical protein
MSEAPSNLPQEGSNTQPTDPGPAPWFSNRQHFEKWSQTRPSWLFWAVMATVIWFIVFSLGILVDSTPFRESLGWTDKKAEHKALVEEIAKAVEDKLPQSAATGESEKGKGDNIPPPVPKENQSASPTAAPATTPGKGDIIFNFGMGILTYLPLNVGLLTIIAAFIGGCSVNSREVVQLWKEVDILDQNNDESAEANRLRKQLNYLMEHPGYSAIRGLIIYLVVIGGLFLAGTQLFGEEKDQVDGLTQYIKMAGIFSFLGYLAGFDPTVFTSMVDFSSARVRPSPAALNSSGPQSSRPSSASSTGPTR